MKANILLVRIVGAMAVLLACSNASANKDIRICVDIKEHWETTGTKKEPVGKYKKADKSKGKKAAPVAEPGNEEPMPVDGAVKENEPVSYEAGKADKPGKDTLAKDLVVELNSLTMPPALTNPEPPPQGDQAAAYATDKKIAEAQVAMLKAMKENKQLEEPRYSEVPGLDYNNDALPIGQTGLVYLKRLLEHFITHQEGYASAEGTCDQRMVVELYPLKRGWTAFARYSGTNREEKVDQLLIDELSPFAERAVLALLGDVPLSATINRDNVLESDTKKSVQRIKGSAHFVLNVGTQLKGGMVNQVNVGGDNSGQLERGFKIFHPMKLYLGYRGKFENWGLETMFHFGLGLSRAVKSDANRGHVDYGGDTGMAIHFLKYFNPRGLTSFYMGSGASFGFSWFKVIEDEYNRSSLFGGGLDVDAVFGWEFMRASSVQFYLQGELNLPAYIMNSANDGGKINTWLPGFTMKLGVVF